MQEQDDAIRQAVWNAITETATHRDVAAAIKRRFGWRCSERQAVARLSQMLSPRDPHQLPADALPDVIRITGRDEITAILLRAGLRKAPLRSVRTRERKERRA